MFEFLHRLNESNATTGGYYALRLLEYRQLLEDAQSIHNELASLAASPQESDVAIQVISEIEKAEHIPINHLDPAKVELYSNQLRGILDNISSQSIYNDPRLGHKVLEELRSEPSGKKKEVDPDLRIQLINDIPEYGLAKGARGIVIETNHEPELTYTAEFNTESGSSTIVRDIKASEVLNLNDVAKEMYEHAMALHNEGKQAESEPYLRLAIELQPGYLAVLHNNIVKFSEAAAYGKGTPKEMHSLIAGLRFILSINPDYEIAQHNIAVVYLNNGVERARENDIETALELYNIARGIRVPSEVAHCLTWNFIAAYTALSIQAQKEGKYRDALKHARMACAIESNNQTRFNLGAAYINFAGFYIMQKEIDAAHYMLTLAEDTGTYAAQWYANLGAVWAARGQIDLAIDLFRHALQLAPEDQFAQTNLSNLLTIKTASEAPPDIPSESPPELRFQIGVIPILPMQPQTARVAV